MPTREKLKSQPVYLLFFLGSDAQPCSVICGPREDHALTQEKGALTLIIKMDKTERWLSRQEEL